MQKFATAVFSSAVQPTPATKSITIRATIRLSLVLFSCLAGSWVMLPGEQTIVTAAVYYHQFIAVITGFDRKNVIFPIEADGKIQRMFPQKCGFIYFIAASPVRHDGHFLLKSVENARGVGDDFCFFRCNAGNIRHGKIGVRGRGGGIQVLYKTCVQIIVAVTKTDIRAFSHPHTGIARGGQTGIFLIDDFYPRIAGGIVGKHCGAVVGRAVVDADKFKIGKSLRQNAVEAAGQNFFMAGVGFTFWLLLVMYKHHRFLYHLFFCEATFFVFPCQAQSDKAGTPTPAKNNFQIKNLAKTRGADIPLADKESFDAAFAHAKKMTDDIGVRLIPTETNYREQKGNWSYEYGSVIVACLEFFPKNIFTARQATPAFTILRCPGE